jgi:serine/threonine protein phosphatase PrpC
MNTRFYYALYNEAHGDDQVNIFQAGDYHVFTVADGVSECELGRVASVLACAAFEECFMERVVEQGG